jgi:serine/threonine protein kinase
LNQYKLTSSAGTRRYMAPEVVRCLPYGTPSDVYSFSLVLWEILTLKTPFENETRESHARKVCGYRNLRPKVKLSWPRMLQKLLRDCWCADASMRPSFAHIEMYLTHSKKC